MPSIEANVAKWSHQWRGPGENWSKPWGGSVAQWYGCVYPRIRRFVPAAAVLEIAPGFGRWTTFLLEHCDTLIGVDISQSCIDACKERFADEPKATFESNDGRTLPMVADSSIDFAFSFDSLTHVDAEVLRSYFAELVRVLKPDGVAFFHHSNYGTYRQWSQVRSVLKSAFDHLPSKARDGLKPGLLAAGAYKDNWRDPNMTAAAFAELSDSTGMSCVGQEIVNWSGGPLLIDCFSVLTRPGSVWDRPNEVATNRLFGAETRSIRKSGSIFGNLPPSASPPSA